MKTYPAILLPAVILAFSFAALAQGNDAYTRRSLLGLTSLQVAAGLLFPPGVTGPVTDVELEVEAERVLKRAGINIIGGENLSPLPGRPRLYFRVQVLKPADQPLIVLSIESEILQKVHLERDSSLSVDAVTWSLNSFVATDAPSLKRALIVSIGRAAEEFTAAFREQNPKK